MSFINMGLATIVVLIIGLFPMNTLLLPAIYATLCAGMLVLFKIIA
jgi:hypothetical protein